jgi:hypothetical protein
LVTAWKSTCLPAGRDKAPFFSRSQSYEGKKELPYWLSMCCQGLSEEFLNNFNLNLSFKYTDSNENAE